MITCYKEKKYLEMFFKNLRKNTTRRFEKTFPFVSHWDSETNYLKCADVPFIVTHLNESIDMIHLNHLTSSNWLFSFKPELLKYNKKNGRLYYIFEGQEIINKGENVLHKDDPRRLKHLDDLPCRIGLIRSDLAVKLMNNTQLLKEVQENGREEEVLRFEYKRKFYKLKTFEGHPCEEYEKYCELFSN